MHTTFSVQLPFMSRYELRPGGIARVDAREIIVNIHDNRNALSPDVVQSLYEQCMRNPLEDHNVCVPWDFHANDAITLHT
jgi:hypothetical protein